MTKITKREAAIIMAYTGIVFGCPNEFHRYAEELLGRSIFIHEFTSPDFIRKLQTESEEDFINLSMSINRNKNENT
jgi:hypothetical protein